MVVDTSALIAIFFEEPGYTDLIVAIEQSEHAYISTGTLLEIYMVFFGKGKSEEQEKWNELMSILRDLGVSVVPFAEGDQHCAIDGFRKYGKGRGSGAKLNYGDCISYGTANAVMKRCRMLAMTLPKRISSLQRVADGLLLRPKCEDGWAQFFADPDMVLPDNFEIREDLPVQER